MTPAQWLPVDPDDHSGRPTSPYKHWHERMRPDFTPGRGDADRMTTLLDQAFAQSDVVQKFVSRPVDYLAYRSIDLVDQTVPLPSRAYDTTTYQVLVGAIDIDIPLGHRAFRRADGTTRVLEHWSMGDSAGTGTYGPVYTEADINRLLKAHSPNGDLTQPLDEDGFNRAIGALNFTSRNGARGLGRRHAHGAHMLDVAGGAQPGVARDFSDGVGLITAAMPSRREFGEGGEFLDQHMVNAAYWMWQVADTYNQHARGADQVPCVACLAFGRQAGAKREDTDLFSRFLQQLRHMRGPGAAPLDFVVPTGNDNQNRAVARYTVPPGGEILVNWRIKPGDQTDNYLEIWADRSEKGGDVVDALAVWLDAPGTAAGQKAVYGPPGTYHDVLTDTFGRSAARIYRQTSPEGMDSTTQSDPAHEGYLLAVGPTEARGNSLGEAPAGRWTVRLKNRSKTAISVNLSVQTDQSIQVAGQFSGRSYLDDPAYEMFDDKGAGMDAIRYVTGQGWQVTDPAEGVRRHGTINVAASQSLTAVVSGYRVSDGQPAAFASSGLEMAGRTDVIGPNAALPVDDTAVLKGTLASGSMDGSRVAMRGTSFAASKAVRVVAERWLHSRKDRTRSAGQILKDLAHGFEDMQTIYPAGYDRQERAKGVGFAKFGEGRVPFRPEPGRVPRG